MHIQNVETSAHTKWWNIRAYKMVKHPHIQNGESSAHTKWWNIRIYKMVKHPHIQNGETSAHTKWWNIRTYKIVKHPWTHYLFLQILYYIPWDSYHTWELILKQTSLISNVTVKTGKLQMQKCSNTNTLHIQHGDKPSTSTRYVYLKTSVLTSSRL